MHDSDYFARLVLVDGDIDRRHGIGVLFVQRSDVDPVDFLEVDTGEPIGSFRRRYRKWWRGELRWRRLTRRASELVDICNEIVFWYANHGCYSP